MGVNADELLARAQQETGLTDFGPDGWQVGFERLVVAIGTDLAGDDDAVERVEAIVARRLVNRLRVEDWYATHAAEAAAHPVEGPLVVLGTGRSGTTALHHLLAQDPRFRTLRKWEIEDPVPPPVLGEEADDPRRPAEIETTAMHIATVDGPTEDRRIHELSFNENGRVLGLPSYVAWWREADHTLAFPYHERILRMLHSHRPPHRWLLKAPEYLFHLEPIAAHYPDARFVMTHRDPVKVIPSVCSVTAEHTRMRLPNWSVDPAAFGHELLAHHAEGVRRFMAARDAIGEDRFIDVGQPEIQADPIGAAERVYAFAGLDLRDDVRTGMVAWSEANRAGSRGQHHYSVEEFGLTEIMIREAFAGYLDRYGEHCAPRT